MRSIRFTLFVSLLVAATTAFAGTADDKPLPAWLQAAAKKTTGEYPKDVPAVVLHSEQTVNVAADGTLVITTDYAMRLLTRSGKQWADAAAGYLKNSSKVRDISAWLIRTENNVKFYGKDKVMDAVGDPDDIYDEYRVKSISAAEDAEIGMVFGFETVVEEKPLFTQDRWEFQRRLPTLYSKYTLNLPAGWQATSVTFNRPALEPTVNGSSYSWEMRDMAPIPPEPDGLSVVNLAPRIVVNYYPSSANSHVYASWADVSKWYTELSSSSLTLDDAMAAKAREIAGNATTEIERIRAVAEFVQATRYISLDIDVARGGGHRPRPASVVLERGFGDCKDKANLMRTLLKALKIDSYLVLIHSGDPTYVRAEWASPGQFNHCIIAIKVSADTTAPTVMTNDKLGRLLIFDPTDPYTQLGDLPEHEQGSMALVSAGADGDLLKMPLLPPDVNRMERVAELSLTDDGSVSGTIKQKAFGQSASFERGKLKELTAADYRTSMEKWLSARVQGGSLVNITQADQRQKGEFDLDMEFKAPTYAQVMQGRLMMFKPAMVGRLDQFVPVEGKRMTPILIDANSYSEKINVKLPAGFAIDEMPAADKIETPFGRYESKFEVVGDKLLFTRNLVLNRTVVPASAYDDVSKFFGVVRRAEQSPVVLIKK